MGYRTVVILNNDMASTWENDQTLGEKISIASAMLGIDKCDGSFGNGSGRVVECVHSDRQSLVTLAAHRATIHTATNWYRDQTEEERDLALLKKMADKMGFRLVKKSVK